MAKLDTNQLVEVSQIIDGIQRLEADTDAISIGTVFIENGAGESLGLVSWDSNVEKFVWEQTS